MTDQDRILVLERQVAEMQQTIATMVVACAQYKLAIERITNILFDHTEILQRLT